MQLPVDWLSDFTEVPDDTERLAEQLTQLGLEVEAIDHPADRLESIRIVTLERTETHPNNDDLTVCEVSTGDARHRVVTAAENLTNDNCYVWAPPGSSLGSGTVEEESIGGVESSGMLCSLEDLGLTGSSGALLELNPTLEAGSDAVELLRLDQPILDIDLTPNRADCLSVLGVARDYGAFLNREVNEPTAPDPETSGRETPGVTIEATDRCARYHGLRIDDVQPEDSSLEVQRRLVQMGLRPRNQIVDLTNFVLFEQGNPLHAFDRERLSGTISVRLAGEDEQLTTIDGTEVELEPSDLLIADDTEPRALAGIMGGAKSAVDAETGSIFLEGAWFDPPGIRHTSQRLKLHTDSSHRFERGVDPGNVRTAMNRFVHLLNDETTGDVRVHEPVEVVEREASTPSISLRPADYENLVGYSLDADAANTSLKRLGCRVDRSDSEWTVQPPTWRRDLNRTEDLIEELLRLDGYETVPSEYPSLPLNESPRPTYDLPHLVREALSSRGFHETVTFSFHGEDEYGFAENDDSVRAVRNPLSREHRALRKSLLDTLLPALEKNVDAGVEDVKLYGIGRVFPDTEELEPTRLAMLATGSVSGKHWDEHERPFDFYDLKGIIGTVLTRAGHDDLEVVPAKHRGFEPERCAEIRRNGSAIGRLGQVKPERVEPDLDADCWGAEIELSRLTPPETTRYRPFSREPFVKRDLDLVVDREQYARELKATIRETARWLERTEVFDLYRGEPLPSDKKSVSFRLFFRAEDRTLSDDEVNETQEAILDALRNQHGAVLRDE